MNNKNVATYIGRQTKGRTTSEKEQNKNKVVSDHNFIANL